MAEKRAMYETPSHYVGFPDGEYPNWKVNSPGSQYRALSCHLPDTDPSFKAAIVQDGFVVGVVRVFRDAQPVVARTAAPPTTGPVSPVPARDEPESMDQPDEPEPAAPPVAVDWSKASWPDIRAEFIKRGWSQKGTMPERIAKLTQEG